VELVVLAPLIALAVAMAVVVVVARRVRRATSDLTAAVDDLSAGTRQ
jgi:hypothetical protein